MFEESPRARYRRMLSEKLGLDWIGLKSYTKFEIIAALDAVEEKMDQEDEWDRGLKSIQAMKERGEIQ